MERILWIVIIVILLLLLIAFLLVGGGIPSPGHAPRGKPIPKTPEGKYERARSDMRSVALALEAYFIDNNAYPVWTIGSDEQSIARGNPLLAAMPTWRTPSLVLSQPGGHRVAEFFTLTTPIVYLTSFPVDPFNPHQDAGGVPTFSYYGTRTAWIVLSPGPDGDFDIDPRSDYDPDDMPATKRRLEAKTYDPTNGLESGGDIVRIH